MKGEHGYRMTRRVSALMLLAMLMSGGLFYLAPTPAGATCFSGEQTIFVRDTNKTHAYGTTNEMLLNDRDLALNCNNSEAWTTAHVEPGSDRWRTE